MALRTKGSTAHTAVLVANVEGMVRTVYPDFRVDNPPSSLSSTSSTRRQAHNGTAPKVGNYATTNPNRAIPSHLYPSMPFGVDSNVSPSAQSPMTNSLEEQVDLTAADMGWDLDFATMDMEAFLSIDPTLATNIPV